MLNPQNNNDKDWWWSGLIFFYDLEHLPLWSRHPVITVTGVSNLARLSPCPSCPCSPWPQLHTSVCRVGSTSWSSGMAPPSGVRATARILGRPAFLSSRGDTAGVRNREVCPLHRHLNSFSIFLCYFSVLIINILITSFRLNEKVLTEFFTR